MGDMGKFEGRTVDDGKITIGGSAVADRKLSHGERVIIVVAGKITEVKVRENGDESTSRIHTLSIEDHCEIPEGSLRTQLAEMVVTAADSREGRSQLPIADSDAPDAHLDDVGD